MKPEHSLQPNPAHASLSPVEDPAGAALRVLYEDSRSEATRKAYDGDLRFFFRWAGFDGATPEAARALCSQTAGELAFTLAGYKAHMRERGLSESTVNRRLAAVRSLLRTARKLGANVPDPAGLVDSEKVQGYRDTSGPGLSEAALLLAAPDRRTLKGKRDFAILLLFFENALRQGEVLKCNVSDFEPKERRLFILGKGRGSQREAVTLSDETVSALMDYLAARGHPAPDAPLFLNTDRAAKGEARLGKSGLYKVIGGYGEKILGKKLSPHRLRHGSITAALEGGWKLDEVQKLSRHKDVRTLQIYDDRREDKQGAITAQLSERLKRAREDSHE